jgi:hypothetical protein
MVSSNQTMPVAAAQRTAVPRLLVGGLSLIAVAAVLTIMAVSAVSPDGQIRWGAVALAAFCAGLLPLMAISAGSAGLGLASWRIGAWSLVWGALAFGLASISWIGTVTGTPAEILATSVPRALWMIGVAMLMFSAGYCVGPWRLCASRARRAADRLSFRFTDQIRGPAVPWLLLGVGLAAQFGFALLTGHLGYIGDAAAAVSTASGYSQYLAVAGECVQLSVAAAALRAYQVRTPSAGLTLWVLFAIAVVVGAVGGGKESFVVAILAVIIPRTIARRRIPAGIIAAAVLFFLLVVIPFNQAYRASVRGSVTLTTGRAVAAAPAIAGQVLASDISPAILSQSARYLAERIRTIDSPAIIMQRTPSQIPYSSTTELLVSPFADLIPRILWPGKPILTPGYQVSQDYYELPADVYTSSNVTPEGDLYRHGGWVPLIGGMLVLGCVIRILDEITDLRRSAHGALLILLLFPGIVQAGSDCASLLAGIPGMIALWLVVVRLSFTPRPAPGSPR